MPFFTEHMNRQVLEQVASMLEHYSAGDLTDANDFRFEDPPPPYTSSPGSTRPHSPLQEPMVDEVEAIRSRVDARYKAMPKSMFELQARREMGRILHQNSASSLGRRPTLHFDKTLDIRENAENNVRQYWLEDGIWDDAWGDAWPSGRPALGKRAWKATGVSSGPKPRGHWRHEGFLASDSNQPAMPLHRIIIEASRPCHQFGNQVLREQRWIQDEREWEALMHRDNRDTSVSEDADVDTAARQAVSQFWRENHIWQPQWLPFPGQSWAHEVPDASLEGHPLYRQLYNVPEESLAGASALVGRAHGRTTRSDAPLGIFDTNTAARPIDRAPRRLSSTRQQGQKNAGLRRSQRIKDREERTVRRSLRLQQRQAAKPPQRRFRKRD